jgi:hypothetical protein
MAPTSTEDVAESFQIVAASDRRRDPEWALLAECTAEELARIVNASFPEIAEYWDCVVLRGQHAHCALVDWEPGTLGSDERVLVEVAKATGKPAYTVGLAGRLDPDHGLPFISVCQPGQVRSEMIWMATSFEDGAGELRLVEPPTGLPSDDPLAFAEALGCSLPHDTI